MFKQAFKITNSSIILAIPLIIFMKISNYYTAFAFPRSDTLAKTLVAFITLSLMIGVLGAAFFYLVKKAVEISKKDFIMDNDKHKEILSLFKLMPEGIGLYAIPFVGLYFICSLIEFMGFIFTLILGSVILGSPSSALLQGLDGDFSNPESILKFLNSLSSSDLLYLFKWVILQILVLLIIFYILMLWVPEFFYKTRNPLKSLFTSIAKVFKDFVHTFVIYLFICVVGIVIFFVFGLSYGNPIMYLIANVLYYYYCLYIIFLIFTYYDNKYNVNAVENNSDNEE